MSAATGAPAAGSGLVGRIGLALVRPRWALAVAGDRRFAGRSGTDLIVLIAIVLAATQLRGLAGAVWLGSAIDAGLGLRAVTRILTGALTLDLSFLVVGALVLWLGAGPRRNLGRAFDLACVAAVPLLVIDLGAIVVARGADAQIPTAAGWILRGASWGWAGALLALAWRPARTAPLVVPPPPREVVRPARLAGWVVIAVVAVGVGLHVTWLTRNLDLIRPVDDGMEAPAFALPTIGPRGELGRPFVLGKGRVTVLDFWATWCGPCLRAMPKLEAIAARYPDVDVVAINLDDAAAARAMLDERGWTRLVLVANDGKVSQRYNVGPIPHSVVIDASGIVRHVARGGGFDAEAAVRAALARQIRK